MIISKVPVAHHSTSDYAMCAHALSLVGAVLLKEYLHLNNQFIAICHNPECS
jgi:hypothetical protein